MRKLSLDKIRNTSHIPSSLLSGRARFIRTERSESVENHRSPLRGEPVPKLSSPEIRFRLKQYPMTHAQLVDYLIRNTENNKQLDRKTLLKLLKNGKGLSSILEESK